MEEKTQQYIDEFLKAIQENNCTNFNEACMYISFSRATAYNHGLDKLDILKEAIDANKIRAKHKMKKNWINSDNATLQLAAFRLLSDSEEHQKLNQSYIDHTTKGKEVNLPSWLNDKHEEDTNED
jgi:hypothetical protein